MEDILSEQRSFNLNVTQPPPDEPAQDKKLWWPRTVAYRDGNLSDGTNAGTVPLSRYGGGGGVERATLATTTQSAIYPVTLASNEFRLLCLTTGPDKDSPTHVTLETHSDEYHPEYEAVSYTWAGDDGDASLCRPIFIGPYWDVLFQTQNCWDLVRFMRPTRGIRLIWIDSLCINQRNMQERAEQVAKMSQIYRHCTKVVVYLGPDVTPTFDDRYPRRQWLHEMSIVSMKQELEKILERKYFKRIWIIQELVFAPRMAMRVGQREINIDSRTTLINWNWEEWPTPWFEHACRQKFLVQNTWDALELVSKSRCTDPRDRLFAILALLPSPNHGIEPDYSVSAQHVCIGFFAHCLLVERTGWFLFYATGVLPQRSVPSWVPEWNSIIEWKYSKRPADYEFDKLRYELRMMPGVIEAQHRLIELTGDSVGVGSGGRLEKFHERIERIGNDKPLVCSRTGALLDMRLQHLFTIPHTPTKMGASQEGGEIFKLKQNTGPALYIVSKVELDKIVMPGCDHIFHLPTETREIWLILREENQMEEPLPGSTATQHPVKKNNDYYLVAACLDLSFGLKTRSEELYIGDTLYGEIRRLQNILNTTSIGLSSMFHIVFFDTGLESIVEKVKLPRLGYAPGYKHWDIYWMILPVCFGLFREQWLEEPCFDASYLSCLDPKYQPEDVSGYFRIKIPGPPREWIYRSTQGSLQWKIDDGEWQTSPRMPSGDDGLVRSTQLRVRKDEIRNEIYELSKELWILRSLELLRKYSVISTSSTLPELVDAITNPREEYKSIMTQDWRREFTVDGRFYDVNIK
ncbi:heterokaryon incompatibility protein-domain-containing protein [Hypoxylon fragiforme]|uniref:heterokaryon incompatibility protein-domain-containing protein n=1 Tax=Hypoxylon fragiforme TaxID=63214 RepID=UPI0020C5DD41|nr:heterokaryon incompatibility protein-domain-containing protein [Hypoxylon fragiforme]XP_049115409.1 heterokaryon incompatibility protein-domain-containing protein [Hypoxylon fragiforme]KAI2602710.1 heterokaryon incompatibility protein-domain-containing protein [Hypoxylon fragiforme]KAI2607009.1 heterokaryon incompatibility protein-domain-containing protein [Hypoxylon fragiforme]